MARRKREPTVRPEAIEANRAYIQAQIDAGRRPVRFRYQSGDQAGAQSTATPLRFLSPDTLLTIEHSTRTPRAYRLDQLETLSDDEPRPEPFRVGDPAEIARGEEYRAARREREATALEDAREQEDADLVHRNAARAIARRENPEMVDFADEDPGLGANLSTYKFIPSRRTR